MYNYSGHSQEQRSTLHSYLSIILDRTLETDDLRIDQGARSREDQWAAFRRGASKVQGDAEYPHMVREDGRCYAADIWPYINGKRLQVPSMASIVNTVQEAGPDDETIEAWLTSAVGRYAQFAYFIRRVEEVATIYFAEIEAISGERWVLRWGGNWDMDAEILTDQNFDDYPHVEIRRVRG
jgi:hypothetical protein